MTMSENLMSEPIDSDGDPLKLTEDATCGGDSVS